MRLAKYIQLNLLDILCGSDLMKFLL